MRAILTKLYVFIAFVQISGEFLKNELKGNNDNPDEVLFQNDTNTINCCVIREIIHRIEDLLQKQLERGELKINSVLKPEEIVPNVRKIRQSDDTFNFNQCVLKSEMEQHNHLETEHIFAIKQELEKLKELVRLLRDQQQILNMLTDIDNKPNPKSEDEEDQRKLIKLFRMLQNHLPQEAKSDSLPLPFPTQNSEDMKKIMIEIKKLQQQIENSNRIAEERLKIEVARQQNHLHQLHGEIENLKNGQALFIQLNSNKSQVDSNNQSEIVGANLPKLPISSLLEKLKPKPFERKSDGSHDIRPPSKTSIHRNQKVRASSDDFFESLQRILDNDPIPETKELPFDFEINPNSDMEKRLLDLEKQLKISTKVQNLEKKIKQLHDANAETKNLDDEDEDLKVQVKKLQRQLKNMNKGKVESKDLDEENILDELKSLQNAINDLRPKEDTSQAKIGSAELQVMLNNLIGVPAVPVRPAVPVIPTHSQLTPAQVQILRRVMAMKAASNQHHTGHSPAHSNTAFSAGHGGLYSGYGGDYAGGYGQGIYNAYETSYGHGGGSHAPSVGYGYTYSNPYGALNGYTPAAGSKYGQYGSVAQYLFGGLHRHPNSRYDYIPYPGFGGYYATEVGGNAYNPLGYGPAGDYISNGGYGATPGYQAAAVTYKPSKAVYPAANDGTKFGSSNYLPASKAYNQGEDRFFRDFEVANAATYQSDASQSYPNTQENSYSGDPYTQEKIEELHEQIYKLQSVINNINRPEYVQKPEDQQTIYELDSKITNLKNIVNNLVHPQTYGYGDESGKSDGYNTSPKSSGDRFKRDLNNIQEVNNSTALNEFLQQVEDILSVINYFTNDWYQKHKEDNSIEKSREVRQVSENLLNHVSKFIGTLQKAQRKVREVKEESPLARILNKLHSLAEFVDSLGDKVKQFNQTCTANGNCEPKATRRKREADDSEEDDDILGAVGALGTALQGMMAEDGKDEDNKVKKEVHPAMLQDKLDDLKQQLEHKIHPGPSARAHSKPQHRSPYNAPVNYQPNYYNQLPTYYTIYDDDEYKDKDKHKLDKDKFVKIEVKKHSKFDKIFSKILDKIIIKVIKVIPIVLQKLIGIEIEKEIDIDSGGGYYDDGYGVQKKQKFGILGLIPAIIFKLLSGISYFVKKLKKVPFIKTFLVPGLVTVGTAGLVIFLVWWLTGDDYYYDSYGYGGGYKDNHAYGESYQNNYQDNYGYDTTYRSGNSINFERNNLEHNRFRNSEPRPFNPNRNALTHPQRSTVMYNRSPFPYNYHPMANYRNLPTATPYRLNKY